MVTKKDYGSSQPGGQRTKVEYVVLHLVVRHHSGGEIWAAKFEQRYIPGKIQKIEGWLLKSAERKLQKNLRRQRAKSGKK